MRVVGNLKFLQRWSEEPEGSFKDPTKNWSCQLFRKTYVKESFTFEIGLSY